jgi:photoactive yellow protein
VVQLWSWGLDELEPLTAGAHSMDSTDALTFGQPELGSLLDAYAPAALDGLAFGVIGFDAEAVVRRYNAFESHASGMARERVLGEALFNTVAPCMNNFLVCQRFEDATLEGVVLDEVIDYVLTLRMKPTKVRLRLLAAPGLSLRYVLVDRRP